MPRVSKLRKLSSQQKAHFLDDFWGAITSLENKKETVDFFKDLLTAEEELMLAKRFQIAMMLVLNYPWDEIDKRVKVTQGTIARLKWRLESPRQGLKKIAKRILTIKRSILEKRRSKKHPVPGGGEILKVALSLAINKMLKETRRLQKKASITR